MMTLPFQVNDSDTLDTKGKVLLLTRRDNESYRQLNLITRKAIQNMGEIDNNDIVAAHASNVAPDYDGPGRISTQQLRDAKAIVVDIPSKDLPLCASICQGLQDAGVGRRLFFVTGNPTEIKNFFETGLGKDFGFHPDTTRESRAQSRFHQVDPGVWPKGKQALEVLGMEDLMMHKVIQSPETVRMVNDERGIVIYDKARSLTNDLAAGVSAVFHLSDMDMAALEKGGDLTEAEQLAFERRFEQSTFPTAEADEGTSNTHPKTDIQTDDLESDTIAQRSSGIEIT